ncbi:MAG: rod-binding protein, partial [Desulfovibrio fairfieldensis]|nr:rod-binding protein [Desulfovibrio fairfieldensis]
MTAPLNAVPAAIPPESARNEGSRRELQAKLAGLGDLGGKKISPEAKAKKLREACEGFESVFIQKMWQEMRNTLPKNGLLHGRDEQYWQDMYDQELSKSMTSAGGIGLADMMYEQLSRNLVSASRGTAGSGRGASFTPTAAPLLQAAPKTPEVTAVADAPSAAPAAPAAQAAGRRDAVPSVYDGAAPQSGAMDRQAAASRVAASADNGADARSGTEALS